MEHKLGIYNGFGIVPTKNFVAAGFDFYVPYIHVQKQADEFYDAAQKSYNLDKDTLEDIIKIVSGELSSRKLPNDYFTTLNVTHLFLAYKNKYIEHKCKFKYKYELGAFFNNNILVFDDNNVPGLNMALNDTLFINSGIKVQLEHNTAGIFFNKSGKGNQGFDTRACVVDEDYSGYVHLSLAFTRDTTQKVYCGDKITQMLILPIIHPDIVEYSHEDYNNVMSNSNRGDKGFGSSDVKH